MCSYETSHSTLPCQPYLTIMEHQLEYDSDDTNTSNLFTDFMKDAFKQNKETVTTKGIKKEVVEESNDTDEEYEEEEEESEDDDDSTKEESSNEQILSDEEETKELDDIIKYKFNNLKRKNFQLCDEVDSPTPNKKTKGTKVIKMRQSKKKDKCKTISGLNIFRKINPNLPDYMKLPSESNTPILFCQLSNYVLRVPSLVLHFNYDELPEANIPENSIPNRCEHVFETKNLQIACGDEAFTSIMICKLCSLTKTK